MIMAPGPPDFGSWFAMLWMDVPAFRNPVGGAFSGIVFSRIDFLVYDAGCNLPEPGSLAIFGLGFAALALRRRRRM